MSSFWLSVTAAQDAAQQTIHGVPAIFHPQSGSLHDIPITVIEENAPVLEDYPALGYSGITVLHLKVRQVAITPAPQKGDKITFNGVNYDIFEVAADPTDGDALLKCRRNG